MAARWKLYELENFPESVLDTVAPNPTTFVRLVDSEFELDATDFQPIVFNQIIEQAALVTYEQVKEKFFAVDFELFM